jgi:hypothetical protein
MKGKISGNFLMKKEAIVVIKPKLLTAMTETKKLERDKLLTKKRMTASP